MRCIVLVLLFVCVANVEAFKPVTGFGKPPGFGKNKKPPGFGRPPGFGKKGKISTQGKPPGFDKVHHKANVVSLTPQLFSQLVAKSPTLWAVKFYAPWCGHCKKLAPKWEAASGALVGTAMFGEVDCTGEAKPLCEKFSVKSYPTIKFFPAGDKPFDYKGSRETKDIIQFAQKASRSRQTKASGSSGGAGNRNAGNPPGKGTGFGKRAMDSRRKLSPKDAAMRKAKAEAMARKNAAMAAAKGGPQEAGMAARRAAAAAARVGGAKKIKWGDAARKAAEAQKLKAKLGKGFTGPPKKGWGSKLKKGFKNWGRKNAKKNFEL